MSVEDKPALIVNAPPGRRISKLWSYRAEIEHLLESRYTYSQIAEAFANIGIHVSLGWLKVWAGKAKLRGRSTRRRKSVASPPALPANASPYYGVGSVEEYIKAAASKRDTPPPAQQESLSEFQQLVQNTSPKNWE